MEKIEEKAEIVDVNGEPIPVYTRGAVVIGSGCAGLNAADTLYDAGMRDITILTHGLRKGTSINTGSDKQTYYKLQTSGSEPDSVTDMAQTLYDCGCMEGFHALSEAASSLRCFYKLVALGVDFPQNEYGEYVGYRTDHDERRRATSCGPLTSRDMAEALISSVTKKPIEIVEHKSAVHLLTDDRRIRGVIAVDTETGELSCYLAPNVFLATGGLAGIYEASVYPQSQYGAIGLAMEAGCTAVNLTEWQYGIASEGFRWNLSGTYMQVIPRFVSVDDAGNEYDFLADALGEKRFDRIFEKGYHWPFCPSQISSCVDIAVYREVCRGRKVYLDYTENEKGFLPEKLGNEAREYLKKSGVLDLHTPIERLCAMNERAYRLYLDKAKIDLRRERLPINVCAQHMNGGIDCDAQYMTSIDGLYAVGECAGVFGVARPGGTALNSTQVSSLRASLHAAKSHRVPVVLSEHDRKEIASFVALCSRLMGGTNDTASLSAYRHSFAKRMSEDASFIRIPEKSSALQKEFEALEKDFEKTNAVSDRRFLPYALRNRDLLISARCVLEAQCRYAAEGFRSRGSFLISENGKLPLPGETMNENDKTTLIKVSWQDGKAVSFLDKTSPIPERETWFETVYNRYYLNK